MSEQYTIYFNDKPYYILSKLTPEMHAISNLAGTIVINQPNKGSIKQTIKDIQQPGCVAVIILTQYPEKYWAEFQSYFTPITAGGGIVLNEAGKVLFIYRRGKWDLPKGKLDDGETIEDCAIREVQEETGLNEVDITGPATYSYHTYFEKGVHLLKTTVWFPMRAAADQLLKPQTEEDIEMLEWIGVNELEKVLANTYPTIIGLMQPFPVAF